MKKLILLFTFFLFSLSFFSITNPAQAQIDLVPTVTSFPPVQNTTSLQEQIDKLRDSNYQQAMDASNRAANSANLVISAFAVVATIFGVTFGVMSVYFGINFYNNKHEMKEQIKEMIALVAAAKVKSNEINKYATAAKKIANIDLPKLYTELEAISKKREKIAMKITSEKGKELERLQKELETSIEKEKMIRTQIERSTNNLQILNTQGTILGNPSVSPSASQNQPVRLSYGTATVSPSQEFSKLLSDFDPTDPYVVDDGQLLSPYSLKSDIGVVGKKEDPKKG